REEFTRMTSNSFPKSGITLGANRYSDSRCSLSPQTEGEESLPAAFDWYTQGIRTPVQDQGSTTWCSVFATVSTMEMAYQIKTGQQAQFSQKALGTCVNGDVNAGAFADRLMDHVMEHGVSLADDVPFDEEVSVYFRDH